MRRYLLFYQLIKLTLGQEFSPDLSFFDPMQILETEYQNIHKGQWLSQTERFLNGTPSGYIIFKELPGLGATHGEILIYLWRHSIIIEPNVPVIVGKGSELDDDGNIVYPSMFGVYKDVSKTAVIRYLKSDITPKKIVCTPEAYERKVKPAIQEVDGFDLYKDFFMLLDESDKLTTETDYRSKIILPMEDFFLFDNKAMVSATALIPSDPRFAQHGFKILKIVPKYEYKKRVNLIGTNNTLGVISKVLEQYSDERYFIFVNSADLIHAIVQALNINSESKAFCASKSVKKLIRKGMINASDTLGGYVKYNFLTSRFFSAVDIKVPYKPNIIVLTNVYKAPHSIVDPYTDVVQITGRLRNGVTRIVHITNYNPCIKYEDQKMALQHIYDGYEEYKLMINRLNQVGTDGGKAALTQATQRIDIKKFVNEKHEIMPYMIDNYLYEQKVRSYYRDFGSLKLGYDAVAYLDMRYKPMYFTISDSQLYELEFAKGRSSLIECVASILHSYDVNPESGVIVFHLGDTKADIERDHPDIAKDYKDIGGYDKMMECEFSQAKITREIKRVGKLNELDNPYMIKEIKAWYNTEDEPTATDVQNKLKDIYRKYEITKPARGTHIKRCYDADLTTNKDNEKVWVIKGVR